MVCYDEFLRVYNRLPVSERNKPVITYQGVTYTWNDLLNLFRTNPQLACFLWHEYKKVVASAPSISIY